MLKTMLNHNVDTTFRQLCMNAVSILVPSVEFRLNDNVQTMLCERWCQKLKSEQTTTFRQQCQNVVAKLQNNITFQHFHNLVPMLRNNIIFNFATTLLQHCRNTMRIRKFRKHDLVILKIKKLAFETSTRICFWDWKLFIQTRLWIYWRNFLKIHHLPMNETAIIDNFTQNCL